MPDTLSVTVNTGDLSAAIADVGAAFERAAAEQIVPAANLIDEAFAIAGRSIQSNLASAAERGEFSLKKLTSALLSDLRRFAIDSLVRRPLENFLTNALTGAVGARAYGGFVAPGQSYLVGERGPELFTPGASGAVSPLDAGAMTVNISLPGVTDAQSFRRSETQVAAALARAVSRGGRNL